MRNLMTVLMILTSTTTVLARNASMDRHLGTYKGFVVDVDHVTGKNCIVEIIADSRAENDIQLKVSYSERGELTRLSKKSNVQVSSDSLEREDYEEISKPPAIPGYEADLHLTTAQGHEAETKIFLNEQNEVAGIWVRESVNHPILGRIYDALGGTGNHTEIREITCAELTPQ